MSFEDSGSVHLFSLIDYLICLLYLFQGLIDGRVEPEMFTSRLQGELNSSPQPCLVPFLKKSLPYLQVFGMNHDHGHVTHCIFII